MLIGDFKILGVFLRALAEYKSESSRTSVMHVSTMSLVVLLR